MEIVRVKAQILNKLPIKEYDALVFLYTDSLGKVIARAKSAFKKDTKWHSLIETMNLVDTNLYKKSEYFYLTETKVVDSFIDIKKDFNKSIIALTVLNIIYKSQIELNPNINLFNLLNHFFNELKVSKNNYLLFFYFIFSFLKIEGIQFPIDKCIICGKELINDFYFDLKSNGFVCSSHRTPFGIEIDETLYKKILKITNGSIDNLILEKVELENLFKIVESILYSHFNFKLDNFIFNEFSII